MTASTRLMNKNFFLLWQGQFVSRLGSQAYMIAMMFWLKHATGSATLMGTLMMLSMLPMVLLGPFGGTFADLHSRKKIIVVSDLVFGVSVLSLAAVMFTMPEATGLIVVWLTVVSVVSGVVSAFFHPAITAAIPSLVTTEQVPAANSINEGTHHIATLIGQGIGGVLFRILGAPVLFLIDGITFIYSAISEAFISIPQVIPERKPSWREESRRFFDETRDGLKSVWGRTGMRNLFLASAGMNFFAMPYMVLFPFYVEDVLGVTPDWYGYILAGYGGGSLLGYLIYGALRVSGRTRGRMLIGCLVALSASLAALGISEHTWTSLALVSLAGLFGGVFNVATITLIQLDTPDEMRGRMFGLLHTLVGGLAPISMGLTGVVADLLDHNVQLIFVVCGACLVVISIVLSSSRQFRSFVSAEPSADQS